MKTTFCKINHCIGANLKVFIPCFHKTRGNVNFYMHLMVEEHFSVTGTVHRNIQGCKVRVQPPLFAQQFINQQEIITNYDFVIIQPLLMIPTLLLPRIELEGRELVVRE